MQAGVIVNEDNEPAHQRSRIPRFEFRFLASASHRPPRQIEKMSRTGARFASTFYSAGRSSARSELGILFSVAFSDFVTPFASEFARSHGSAAHDPRQSSRLVPRKGNHRGRSALHGFSRDSKAFYDSAGGVVGSELRRRLGL